MNVTKDTPLGQVTFIASDARSLEFGSPFPGEDFALLLWVFDQHVSADQQAKLSASIVAAGCRFAVCAGFKCSSWDDSIDLAYLETDPELATSDDSFVMTTWHQDESIDDVAFFFANCVSFDTPACRRRVVLCVGGSTGDWERVQGSVLDHLSG